LIEKQCRYVCGQQQNATMRLCHVLIGLLPFGLGASSLCYADLNDNPLPDATFLVQGAAGSDSYYKDGVFAAGTAEFNYAGSGPYILTSSSTDFTQFGGLNFTPAFDATASVRLWPLVGSELTGESYANLVYHIRVVGPGDQPIAVDYNTEGNVQLTLNYGSTVFAQLNASVYTTIPDFGDQGHLAVGISPYYATGQSQGDSFFVSHGQVLLTPGQDYEIALSASVSLEGFPEPPPDGEADPSVLGRAYVDPVFSIDPSVASASAYSFQISPNIAAIPEAGTLQMLALGLILVTGTYAARIFLRRTRRFRASFIGPRCGLLQTIS
jgi:hypothetical protein